MGTNWAIPTEAVGKVCLLASLDESKEIFSAGIPRIPPGFYREAQ
ncbi:hypothetical protein ACWCOW_32145 [Streptomyces sp. NPDC001939]